MAQGSYAKPWLKPWYTVRQLSDAVSFRYGDHAVILRGAAARTFLPSLLPLLDGAHDRSALESKLGDAYGRAIDNALEVLGGNGLLTEGAQPEADRREDPLGAMMFLVASDPTLTLSTADVAIKLDAARILVAGAGPAASLVGDIMTRDGVPNVESCELSAAGAALPRFTLAVVVPDASELPAMIEFNAAALGAGVPWLQVLPFDGTLAAIGPLFIPRESCCYNCYLLRREANDSVPDECADVYRTTTPRPQSTAMVSAAAGIAASLALRWLATADQTVPGELYALEYYPSLAVTRHRVLRVPRCAECSRLASMGIPDPWSDPRRG